MKVYLAKQECKGTYKFDRNIYYTKGMELEFGECIYEVIFKTLALICKLVKKNVADYFQVAYAENSEGKKVKFYIIDDVDHVTFLLPEEY